MYVRATRADGFDEFFGSDNPSNPPAWETEALGQAIDQENVVLVPKELINRYI